MIDVIVGIVSGSIMWKKICLWEVLLMCVVLMILFGIFDMKLCSR